MTQWRTVTFGRLGGRDYWLSCGMLKWPVAVTVAYASVIT